MKKLTSIKHQEKQRSFASLLLALILIFSFNFTPISLIASKINWPSFASAYSSSTTQTYYSSSSSSKESNVTVGSDAYPNGLNDYFSDSSVNLNILEYYQSRFSDIFKMCIDYYLSNIESTEYATKVVNKTGDESSTETTNMSYKDVYEEYLKYVGYKSLGDYFDAKLTSTYDDFVEYFEEFVTNPLEFSIIGTDETTTYTLKAIFDTTNTIYDFYQSYIYLALANYLNTNDPLEGGTGDGVSDSIGDQDGLTEDTSDFYNDSIQYNRVKTYIDDYIVKTVAIYTYDEVQNRYVAGIIADDAPTTVYYYYTDSAYEEVTVPSYSFYGTYFTYQGDQSYFHTVIYCFNYNSEELSTMVGSLDSSYQNVYDAVSTFITYGSLSTLQSSPLLYYRLQEGDEGYLGTTVPLYYQYNSIPFTTTNSQYDIYIVTDNTDASTISTISSLQYFTVLTTEEWEADYYVDGNGNGSINPNRFYIQIPYFGAASSDDEYYFTYLFKSYLFGGTSFSVDDEYYKNFLNLVIANDGKLASLGGGSRLFLKLKGDTTKVCYLDTASGDTSENFKTENPSYSYTIKEFYSSESGFNWNDYYEIDRDNFSSYMSFSGSYTLYFKKIINRYTKTTATYAENSYETTSTPNVEFEMQDVPAEEYEKYGDSSYKIYVLENGDNLTASTGDTPNTLTIFVGGNEYSVTIISETELNSIRNLYVSVPSSITSGYSLSENQDGENALQISELSFYYKHEVENIKKIYVVDDSTSAKDNEVYKNLHYEVLSLDEYNDEYYNYLIIDSGDSNYNSNFKLYYKYNYNLSPTTSTTDPDTGETKTSKNPDLEKYFIQNVITDFNAIYVVDDSITSSEKSTYRSLFITAITSTEFNKESEFYVALSDTDVTNYTADMISSTLYYKYAVASNSTKTVYLYSSTSSDTYNTFYNTDSDYLASDYELIKSDDPNYVAGLELYYKKIRNETTVVDDPITSYYYYEGSSTISASANSYYALSFYAYTNGEIYDDNNTTQAVADVSASLYMVDTSGVIDDIAVENISTKGEWKQYYVFFKTNSLTASTLMLKLYMGNSESIVGGAFYEENATASDYSISKVSGVVLFDNIVLTLINETDYNNQTIDGVSVIYSDTVEPEADYYTVEIDSSTYYIKDTTADDSTTTLFTVYSDSDFTTEVEKINDKTFTVSYNSNHEVIVTIEATDEETEAQTFTATKVPKQRTYDKEDKYENEVIVTKIDKSFKNDDIISDWSTLFNFDVEGASNNFKNDNSNPQLEAFEKYFEDNQNSIEYYNFGDDSLSWHYYISRENSGGGNYQKFLSYKNAYLNNKVSVSVVSEKDIDKTSKDTSDEETTTDETEEDTNDVATVPSTFNTDNSVLKIENKSSSWALGVVSSTFNIKQNEYYKITIWVYSPDSDASATIKAESILNTSNSTEVGTLLSTTATVDANISAYSTAPTNEYGWIPVTFYIQGNAYQNQDMYLALLASKNCTVYFDNITIEKVTSATYSSINQDSDTTTYCLALSTSSSVIEKGITNGYFNFVNVTDNYETVDYTIPRTAQNWTVQTNSSSNAVAGVVPTSNDYTSIPNNFYTRYSNKYYNMGTEYPFEDSTTRTNIFGIYLPSEAESSVDSSVSGNILNNYSIYSTSVSLSANSLYEIKFSFCAGSSFNGTMISNLYYGTSASSESSILASFSENYSKHEDDNYEPNSNWVTYTFYVETSLSSMSVTLEIGAENAVGTCFFKNVSCVSTTKYSTVDEARDALIQETENTSSDTNDLFNKTSLKYYKFVNMANSELTLHSQEIDDISGTYLVNEYSTELTNNSSYTVGKSGIVVADYYSSVRSIDYFTVEINKVTYYIKQVEVVNTDDGGNETTELVYKLYSDSVFTKEVDEIDGNSYSLIPSASGKTITVKVGESETEYDSTSISKTDYEYNFNEDVVIGNTIISAEELKNAISQNVMILANSYTTDYTYYSPVYSKTLSTSAYYVMKIYVKTSDFVALNADSECGLNVKVDSVNAEWKNINTTDSESKDEYGFVCYQVLISTNTSSITSLGVEFSIGTEENPCSGYAIIAGVEFETIASETLFNEYSGLFDEDDNTIQRFYGTTSSDGEDKTGEDDDSTNTSWATFFYVFSSLLLGIVLIVAIIAAIIKKHPIRLNRKVKVEDNIIITDSKPSNKRKTSKKTESKTDQNVEGIVDADVSENPEENSDDDISNDDEGFV